MRILFADDDDSLCSATEIILAKAGYEVHSARDGAQAVERFRAVRPDLVILDIMMPKLDGYGACNEIRMEDPDVPVIMLSAKGDIVDKRIGFKIGADDYVVKPFNGEELLLRVEALLRRSSARTAEAASEAGGMAIGDLEVNPYSCKVTVRGEAVSLTPTEYQIIAQMAKEPGRVFTCEDLIDEVWGSEYRQESISIPVYIRRIRQKIERDPSSPEYLKTVWRFGYKLGE